MSWEIDQLVKIGSPDLAKIYDSEELYVQVRNDSDEISHWGSLGVLQNGDRAVYFHVIGPYPPLADIGTGLFNLDMGRALIREGSVHFIDTYPSCSQPMRISDFTDDKFRMKISSISKNIEQLLGLD